MPDDRKSSAQEFEYQAEMKQLLHLIVHSLYTHREIFLRELISNASDALNLVRFRQLTDKTILDHDTPLQIRIELNQAKRIFSIEDTGVGMTKEELINNIGTIASSGTLQFLKNMQKQQKPIDASLIGQFGVGFYSVFMVTDEVTIETRHANAGSVGYRWKSVGEGKFTIEQIKKLHRGTKISFTLREDAQEFSEEFRIKNIIKKYSNFVDFPIFIGQEKVNTVSALWQQRKEDLKEEDVHEFYKYISNDFQPPLGYIHTSLEGSVSFKALVFIPQGGPLNIFKDNEPKGLHLYSSRILIQDHCKELLPRYLGFVEGVVDTEYLPLNISREITQSSPMMGMINKILTGRVLSLLEQWAKNDVEKYQKFYKHFSPLLKAGVNTDPANKGRVIELLRFKSSTTESGKYTSLKEYVSRMKNDQQEIYYAAGEHREGIERNPNLEYFHKHGIEVLFLLDTVDVFIIPSIPEYDNKPLKSIDKADISVPAKEEEQLQEGGLNEKVASAFLRTFKEILLDKVEDVIASKRLVDSPVTLVIGEKGLDLQTERMMKMLNKRYSAQKKIMEVNLSHPLIRNLWELHQKDIKNPLLKQCVLHLYEGALLLEGNLSDPAEFVSRMTTLMEKATQNAYYILRNA